MRERYLRLASLMMLIVALVTLQSAIIPPTICAQSGGTPPCPTVPPCVGFCPAPTVCKLNIQTGTCVCI